jgi:hypothetical protein
VGHVAEVDERKRLLLTVVEAAAMLGVGREVEVVSPDTSARCQRNLGVPTAQGLDFADRLRR